MSIPRGEPYIWVTWVSKLLAGEAHCEWALWFRAHYQYSKVPRDFDAAAWKTRHATLVRKKADALRQDGWEVRIEDQNAFALPGRTATLAGKPDIVALKGSSAKVVDCKTGEAKGSDCMQVLIYMAALPHTLPEYRGMRFAGEVCYSQAAQLLVPADLTSELRASIWEVVKSAGKSEPPPRVPSMRECRFCDITAADCPDRLESPPAPPSNAVDFY